MRPGFSSGSVCGSMMESAAVGQTYSTAAVQGVFHLMTIEKDHHCDECGGPEGHASCYSCLRSYRNQKQHAICQICPAPLV